MTPADVESLNWQKGDGLLPVIVQDAVSGLVLLTGFVNREALTLMLTQTCVVLYSRTRKRLWVKGETSGHYITVERIAADCDRDAVLVLGTPSSSVCHTGEKSCFKEARPYAEGLAFLHTLEKTIDARIERPTSTSYVAKLIGLGLQRLAQKVGEEGVEVVLAANGPREALCSESADLLFHLLLLLRFRRIDLTEVIEVLRGRSQLPHRLECIVAFEQQQLHD
jgi:phosphoribosyl-ATP pyrophosphohydrolase/phosphoribosyl-AMP cyclohydrolase